MDENGLTGGWRQSLCNWLAVAALLALGIVWGRDAPPPAASRVSAAHAAAALRAAARAETPVRARLALRN